MSRPIRNAALPLSALSLAAAALLLSPGSSTGQQQDPLAEPFRGVTTNGTVTPGLFPIRATGVTTAPVREAAQAFINSLTQGQRERTLFPVDDREWRLWNNVHRYTRQGTGFGGMTEVQRERAFGLLRAGLSARGLEKTRGIMRLNHHLGELVNNFQEYGEGLYWLTVMGTPSATEPWGWQLDGHHLVINYFVFGDQVVMTPTFMGSEPVRADTGRYAGTVVMQDEQARGLALMAALTPAQRQVAMLATPKGRGNALAQAFRDNLVLDYAGIRGDSLNPRQRQLLMELIGEYVGNMSEGHARVRMEEVRAYLDSTRFAWIGDTGADAVFYYRVHSPVVLIEFDHQGPVALDGPRTVPTRRHVHSVVRTPNGNDYGMDLLRQHHEAHRNNPAHGHRH